MDKILFFDTCTLLKHYNEIFDEEMNFFISSITLVELEHIKEARDKDDDVKFAARQVIKKLNDYNHCAILLYKQSYEKHIKKWDLELKNDSKIIATAYDAFKSNLKDTIFVTEDNNCRALAQFVGFNVKNIFEKAEEKEYTGFKEINTTEEELAKFYNEYLNNNSNVYDLIENQYLIIRLNNEIVAKYKWKENQYIEIKYASINSPLDGEIKPKDSYQECLFDSFKSNQITLVGGSAGTGKTFLSLGYLFSELDKGHIDHIIVFCNPCGARNATKLGFYKGTVRDKILSTQVGHVLKSKMGGDMMLVEEMLDRGTLQIIPVVDARGFEVPPNSGVYILESQNLTSDLMRLILQRVKDDTKIIIDGDREEQLDLQIYDADNGMRKVSKVFKGKDLYGQIDLQKIYRSRIAEIAEEMK